MGDVVTLADRRAKAPQPRVTRTPELALVMALYDVLPKASRRKALCAVMMLSDLDPGCEASAVAAYIAATLALK